MEVALTMIAIHACVPTKMTIQATCKMCKNEYIETLLSDPVKFYNVKKVFKALKHFRVIHEKRKRQNSWSRRKLHTEDEVILVN